jgi:hypothetical protein
MPKLFILLEILTLADLSLIFFFGFGILPPSLSRTLIYHHEDRSGFSVKMILYELIDIGLYIFYLSK